MKNKMVLGRLKKHSYSIFGNVKKHIYPAIVALAVFFTYPSLIAYQDVASLLPSPISQRWLANMNQSPGQTAIAAHVAGFGSTRADIAAGEKIDAPDGIDPIITGSLNGIDAEAVPALIRTRPKKNKVPQRINRNLKGDRVVQSTTIRPPENFTAGSVLQRQSMLSPLQTGEKYELAFVEPRPFREAIEVASLFHFEEEEPEVDADLPVVIASLVRESADHVLAYGGEEESVRSPFAAVLESERPVNLVPKLGKGDHLWAAEPLPLSVFSNKEQHCLTAGIYFEARGEPVRGQAAVAQVILNRVKNPTYPNSVCGVVYQNKKWRNRCQFSFACDRIKDKVRDPERWEVAQYVARETTEGRIWLKQVGSSTHYHATYVRPKWAKRMKKVGRIGLHIFYRTFGGGWS
ncbi:MAG: cell wall hydrolase [Rhizobiaceae bacterium]